MPTPISCYVLTFNSERRLAEVLAAVRPIADEILIVDSGSNDATLEIAARYECRILARPFDNFRDQRRYAEVQCRHEWVLMLDSDEVVSTTLATEIAALKTSDFHAHRPDAPDGYTVAREWFLLGRKVHVFYPVTMPNRPVRLFKRGVIGHKESPLVHERLSGSRTGLGHLDGSLLHYTCDSVDDLYSKINLYTRLSAEQMHADGISCNFMRLHLFPIALMFKWYILLGGWKDGAIGRLHARYVRDVVYLKYLKLKFDVGTPRSNLVRVPLVTGPNDATASR